MGDVRTVFKDEPSDPDRETYFVAIANRTQMEQLLRTAEDFASARGGELLLGSVIHKTVTSPFLLFTTDRIAEEFDDGKTDLLDEAAEQVTDVPVRRQLLISDDIADAILHATRAADADALFVGWTDRTRPSDIVLGTTVDPVVRRAPCDVYLERIGVRADSVESILLPTVGGERMEPAARLTTAVATANDATVAVVSYVAPDADEEEYERRTGDVEETVAMLDDDVAVESAVEPADDNAEAITSASANHDLVVIGSTRKRTIRRRVIGNVARTVGKEAEPPVVIANRPAGRPFLRRLTGWFPLGSSEAVPSSK